MLVLELLTNIVTSNECIVWTCLLGGLLARSLRGFCTGVLQGATGGC